MRYCYLTLLLATAAAPALAQDPQGADGEDGIIVTASRVPLTVREVGSAVSVITGEDLQLAPPAPM